MSDFNYKRLTPFKWFILENFPFIEADFDALTNWQLFCKLGKEMNKIIDSENVLGTQVETLTDFVNNYFDNLDVQDEIDTKLDKMVQDGTFDEIINQELLADINNKVNNLTTEVSENTEDISNLKTNVSQLNNNEINKLRMKYYNNYINFTFPNVLPEFYDILKIYQSNENENYKHNIYKNLLKITGGNTYYVDKVNGLNNNDGLSWETAWRTPQYAFNNTNDNDTIILKKAIYYADEIPSSYLRNSVNLIAEEGTIFAMGIANNYTQNTSYSNVYQASLSNVTTVIDIRGKENNIFVRLDEKTSIQDVANNENSFYYDGNTVYININEEVTNSKVVVLRNYGYSALRLASNVTGKSMKMYLENIVFLNGMNPIVRAERGTNECQLNAYNCKFLFTHDKTTSYNGIDIKSANSIFINCEASYNNNDGFNYHKLSTTGNNCNSIEINCVASNNGRNNTTNNNNGSTTHDGNTIIRIDGKYFNNRGPNIADVNENTISYNFNCKCFDSIDSTTTQQNSDFHANDKCKMYLYNCFAKGNSNYNLYTNSDSDIYINNTDFDSSSGNIIEI